MKVTAHINFTELFCVTLLPKQFCKIYRQFETVWSSPTAQWKRVPESWCRDRETTSSNVDVVRGKRKEDFVLIIVTNATDYMGGSDEQGRRLMMRDLCCDAL